MINNEVDLRFRTFLRRCFLVEIIDGLKWFRIFGPWNYGSYYYRLIDWIGVDSLWMWIGSSVVWVFMPTLATMAILIILDEVGILVHRYYSLVGNMIISGCIASPIMNMHSWYRWWKREQTQ